MVALRTSTLVTLGESSTVPSLDNVPPLMVKLICRAAGVTALSGAPVKQVVRHRPRKRFHQVIGPSVKAEPALVENHHLRPKA